MSFTVIPTCSQMAATLTPESVVSHAVCDVASEAHALIKPYITEGDCIIKTAHCAAYYSVVAFESGVLLLLAPQVPERHGTVISSGGEAVVDVAAGDEHIVFCTVSGAVYSLGYGNKHGQLGDGNIWDRLPEPEIEGSADEEGSNGASAAVRIPRLSQPRRIARFGLAMGGKDATNSCFDASQHETNGEKDNDYGNEEDDMYMSLIDADKLPTRRPNRAVCIKAVACGAQHTLLLSSRGNAVYGCGRSQCGQLSGRRIIPAQTSFRSIQLLFGLPIRQIAAAGYHSFVLLETGKLLAFGDNTCGQLGLGNTHNAVAPTPATFLDSSIKTQKKQAQQGKPHKPPPILVSVEEAASACSLEQQSPSTTVVLTPNTENLTRAPSQVTVKRGRSTTSTQDTRANRRLLDAKAYSSLRAPHGSAESMFFPLRVPRLDAEADPRQPCIVAVWCCATLTVALTNRMEWLSCGLPLSRSWRQGGGSASRYDEYGALGRPLTCVSEAYSFGLMHWTNSIQAAMKAQGYLHPSEVAPETSDTGSMYNREGNAMDFSSTAPARERLECFCYPNAVMVKIPSRAKATLTVGDDDISPSAAADLCGTATTVIFVQSNVTNALYEVSAQSSETLTASVRHPETEETGGSASRKGRLLRDAQSGAMDDDSHMFSLLDVDSILPFQHCVIAL